MKSVCSITGLLSALTILLPLMLSPAAFAGGDYYVSPFGGDLTGDGSPSHPWRTIQYAVGNIFESDATLHVASGTYRERVIVPQIAVGLDLVGWGASVTTIDASGTGGGAINFPEGTGFRVSGFTIQGGRDDGSAGGAIGGYNAQLTSAVVDNNIIKGNSASGWHVGGAVSLGADTVVRNNTFISNSSEWGSGAVYIGANSLVENNFFGGNTAWRPDTNRGSGAVEARDPSVIVRGNIFQENSSGSIWTGTAGGYGGGFSGAATVYDNLFIGNSAQGLTTGYGGAAYLTDGSFIHNTLVGNIGDVRGQASGVYAWAGTSVSNNIIVGGIHGVGISSGGAITADYNDIWNNDLGQYGGFAVPGPHDIHQNPLFIGSGNYRLLVDSPCVDAGGDFGIDIDLDGNFRPFDVAGVDHNGVVPDFDMGAYELTGPLDGDYNGNGVVDAADYAVWRDAFEAGSTDLLNDPTPGDVDESDYTYWKEHFGDVPPPPGAGSGLAAGAAVPEPATLYLAVLALLAVSARRCR